MIRARACTLIGMILLCCGCDSDKNGLGEVTLMDRVEIAMSVDNLRDELVGITSIGHRKTGTLNEIMARDHIIERFNAVGLTRVRTDPFPYILWEGGACSLNVLEPEMTTFEARALGFSPDTPVGGLTGEVVFVGTAMPAEYGSLSPEDYIGKIHLATSGEDMLVHRVTQYLNAQMHKAIGFIHMKHRMGEEGEALIEVGSTHYFADIPVVAIDHSAGMRLREWLDQGLKPRVRMQVDANQTSSTSWNVIGEIPGESPERVTLGAHYDSWDIGPCAIDNGSGVAALIEIARVMVALGPHERTIRFVSFGAEEQGLQGSIAYCLKHLLDIRRHCKLMVNMDMIGTKHGTLFVSSVSEEVKCVAETLFKDTRYEERTGFEALISEFPNLGLDSTPFLILAIPIFSTVKYPFIYYHTEYDTVDKVHWDDLYATTLIHAMAALYYANPASSGETVTCPFAY